MHFRGSNFKNFRKGHASNPLPQTLRLLHGCWPCFVLQNLMTALLTLASIRVTADFHCQIIFTCLNQIGVMYDRPCGNLKVKQGSTFIFMHDLPYIASISFRCIKFMWVHIKITGMWQWKSTLKPSCWHHHLSQVGNFFAHRYHGLDGLFHLNVMTNHLYLFFFRRSTYNHLSSWLTDARNLTNPNTVMSSKCHTIYLFQFMHFEGACQEQDCKAL